MDKTQLQLILIGVGAVIIAAIYFWGKYTERKGRPSHKRPRVAERSAEQEPIFNFDAVASDADTAERKLHDTDSGSPAPQTPSPPSVDVEVMPIGELADAAYPGAQEETTGDPYRQEKKEPTAKSVSSDAMDASASLEKPKLTMLLTIMAAPGQMFQGSSILLAIQEQRLKLREGVFEYFANGDDQGKCLFGVGHLLEPGTFELETIGNLSTPGLIMFMSLPGPMEPVQATNRLVNVAKTLASKLGGSVCDERRNKISAQGFLKMESDAAEFQRQLRLRHV